MANEPHFPFAAQPPSPRLGVMGQQLGILSNIFRARSEDFCLWGTCAQRRASNPRE